MADIAELMFETVEVIAKKLISEVRFDLTVKATIVNDSNAYRGEYLVSTGNATFTAYCADDKYKKDDAVLVTIPEGDYKNLKIIVGKLVDDTNSAIHKLSPFLSMTDVTGNVISKLDSNNLPLDKPIEVAMYANGKICDPNLVYFSWDYGTTDFVASDVYNSSLTILNLPNLNVATIREQYDYTLELAEALIERRKNMPHPGLIWDSGTINFPGYTRLGIQALFLTWLLQYNIVHGHYGLMLLVLFEFVEDIEGEQLTKHFYKYLNFSNDDFFGDSYNFETFYTLEKVFKLDDFMDYPITRLRLFAYEREDFLTMENIPIEFDLTGFTTAGPNIFIKDPYICLGFDAESFEGDSALIYSLNGTIYSKQVEENNVDEEYKNNVLDLKESSSSILGIIRWYLNNLNSHPEWEIEEIDLTLILTVLNLKQWIDNNYNSNSFFYYDNIEDIPTNRHATLKSNINKFNNAYEYLIGKETEIDNLYIIKPEQEEELVEGRLYLADLPEEIQIDVYDDRDEANKKTIELRWIHKDEEKEIIKLMNNGEVPPHYFIYWYRYKLGAKSPDLFAGAHWVRFYGTRKLFNELTPDNYLNNLMETNTAYTDLLVSLTEQYALGLITNSEYELYIITATTFMNTGLVSDLNLDSGNTEFLEKMQALIKKYQDTLKNLTELKMSYKNELSNLITTLDTATNNTIISFYPNVNYKEEKFKAIIIKQDPYSNRLTKIAESNILTFSNLNSVVDLATLIAESALAIKYGESDTSHGVYLIYDRAGHISKEEQGTARTLTAVFDENEKEVDKKSVLNNFTSIKWTFPEDNTMIIPMIDDHTIADTNIFEQSGEGAENLVTVWYCIKKDLNRNAVNNTILLDVVKDGLFYSASVTMIFGTAGTSGSDYTIHIEWLNNQNALTMVEENDLYKLLPLEGHIVLFDLAGVPLTVPDDTDIEVGWEKIYPSVENSLAMEDNVNFIYPVLLNSNYGLTCETDGNKYKVYRFASNYFLTENNQRLYKYFNYNEGTFVDSDNQLSTFSLKYSVRLENESAIPKIVFLQVDKVVNDGGNTYDITVDDYTKEVTYHYNTLRRCFVKYKDVYIIDPWNEYLETETYYFPVLSAENNYNNNNSEYLEINQVENNKFNFVISGKKNYAVLTDGNNNKIVDINTGRMPLIYNDLSIFNNILNSLYIIRVAFNNFGDYSLVACFPMPIKYLKSEIISDTLQSTFLVDYVNGPTNVRYSTGGEVDFDKNSYEIICRQYDSEQGFLLYTHDINLTGSAEEKKKFLPGYWRLIYDPGDESNINQLNVLPRLAEYKNNENFLEIIENNGELNYQSTLQEGEEARKVLITSFDSDYDSVYDNIYHKLINTIFDNPWLLPLGVYYKDAPFYGILYVYKEPPTDGQLDTAELVIWTLPIYVYQDNYPSTTLNKWNGLDILIDNDNGTIVANGMAAGKKESDNTFTGVVLGDWSRTDVDSYISKNTGVYGFNHGAMSYALKDDGTALIGKDGHGRIYFDGNKATIYSAGWVANKNQKTGLLIDVDDGKIHMRGNHNNVLLETEDKTAQSEKIYYYQNGLIIDGLNEGTSLVNGFYGVPVYERVTGSSEIILSQLGNPYFKITANGKTLMHISNNEYFLASSDFTEGTAGVKFNLKSGELEGYKFKIKAIKTSDFTLPNIVLYVYDSEHERWITQNYSYTVTHNESIQIDSTLQTYPLNISNRFKVSWAGIVEAEGGKFDDLSSSKFYAYNISALTGTYGSLDVNGTITGGAIKASTLDMSGGNGSLKINNNGVSITGDINAKSATFSGNVNVGNYLEATTIKITNAGTIGGTGPGDLGITSLNGGTIKVESDHTGINSGQGTYVSCYRNGTVSIGGNKLLLNVGDIQGNFYVGQNGVFYVWNGTAYVGLYDYIVATINQVRPVN